MSKQSNDISQSSEIQALVDAIIGDLNRDSDNVFEPYISYSDKLLNAVSVTRKKLGIEKSTIPKNEQASWLETNKQTLLSGFETTGLPKSWYTFFVQYVATNTAPSITETVAHRRFIEVTESTDDSITIKISKGVRFEEYTAIWKALSPFLGTGRRKNKQPDYDTRIRDLQMYGKQQSGYTNKMIADDYVVAINDDNAKDTVKKAIRRQKKLFEKGTDLAE